jgi:hypothetical protein
MYQIQANFRLIAILESGRLALVAKEVAKVGDTLAILHGLVRLAYYARSKEKKSAPFMAMLSSKA